MYVQCRCGWIFLVGTGPGTPSNDWPKALLCSVMLCTAHLRHMCICTIRGLVRSTAHDEGSSEANCPADLVICGHCVLAQTPDPILRHSTAQHCTNRWPSWDLQGLLCDLARQSCCWLSMFLNKGATSPHSLSRIWTVEKDRWRQH